MGASRRSARGLVLVALLAGLALVMGACGDDSDDASPVVAQVTTTRAPATTTPTTTPVTQVPVGGVATGGGGTAPSGDSGAWALVAGGAALVLVLAAGATAWRRRTS